MLQENNPQENNSPMPQNNPLPQSNPPPLPDQSMGSAPVFSEPKKPGMFNFKFDKNVILIGVAILIVLVTGVLLLMNSGSSNILSMFTGNSKEATAQKAIDYLNENMLPPGQTATLGKVSLESGIIKIEVKIGSNSYDSYVTTDGKLFFPQEAIEITPSSGNKSDTVKVSVDDDPVLGNEDAPITMIEFSDYECPFCKRHFDQVFPQIKKDYIDTGKVKLVFRDFVAVQGHNPLATTEAYAANCAREQGGDVAYFNYHDELFKRTTSNGSGLKLTELAVIAKDLGLNSTLLQQCVDSNKHKAEFDKDNADALVALPKNDAGTPSFFIGKSTADGMIDGQLIQGAQSYESFKSVIDALLAS